MKHILVTNDFPPKIGGIQSLLWEWWRRLPSDSFAVLTSPYDGAAEFDASQSFRIERTREPVLLPHPLMTRRINDMSRDFGADFVVLDPALPLAEFDLQFSASEPSISNFESRPPDELTSGNRWIKATSVGLLIVLMALVVAWWRHGGHGVGKRHLIQKA